MCAIVDANVKHDVFGGGQTRSEAAGEFFEWIDQGKGTLVVGGKLLDELAGDRFNAWFQEARSRGKAVLVDKQAVERRTKQLEADPSLISDDPHVIALALESGARLLYTHDRDLQRDFCNKNLVAPVGKIYTTLKSKDFTSAKRKFLDKNVCSRTTLRNV